MIWNINWYQTLESTNQEAKKIILDSKQKDYLDRLVLVANQQTKGKGRMDRAWVSHADTGLWFSAVKAVELPVEQAGLYSYAAAVAVVEAIQQETEIRAKVKWPNDILLNGKKVCGILLELVSVSATEHYIVIGMGINVNQKQQDFPKELRHKAISLTMFSRKWINRSHLLTRVLQKLDENCTLLEKEGFMPVRDKWKEHSCMLGQEVLVQEHGKDSYYGVAEELAMDGTLLVRVDDRIEPVQAGDVSLRAKDGGIIFDCRHLFRK